MSFIPTTFIPYQFLKAKMLLVIRFWGVQRRMVHYSNVLVFPITLDSAEKGVIMRATKQDNPFNSLDYL